MRTPNAECVLCNKPLYRRPFEFKKTRYFACMNCRSDAQKFVGITDAQIAGLKIGRKKGTNHRAGYKHKEESKRKASESNKRFCANNRDKVLARGAKTRGELNVNWKGGVSRLNISIRQMTENRRWMDKIKERDGCCVRCGSGRDLESHHLTPLGVLIEQLGIKSRSDARKHGDVLWDLSNGETLCQPCHYAEHGRIARAA